MRIRLIALTAALTLLVLAALAVMVQRQTLKLAGQERELVKKIYAQSKEVELRHYVSLAQAALGRLAAQDGDVAAQQRQALSLLSQMQFGKDGYFFVYDRHGNMLLEPSQMGLQGIDFCEPDNPAGFEQAGMIMASARQGGGLVRYDWMKPSSRSNTPKMSFVAPVAPWGWVLGAGLYMDDIEATLNIIDSHARQNIEETRRNFYGIAAAAVLAIGLAGLAFNLSGQRVASGKLQRLAQRVVRSQEDERVRVARELHDGVVQVMVSSKFLLETAQASLPQAAAAAEGRRGARQLLDQGLQRLNDALAEIRRVSHGLRPALLDDLGLAAALALLVEQIRAQCPYRVDFVQQGQVRDLPTVHATALFRVAQEAFNNIQAHARPTAVQVVLRFGARTVSLRIIDDGQGFDLQRVQADARGGIGLRNMRERMESLQGRFEMQSGRQGTRLVVTLPLPAAAGAA